jgi:hypothetical protein
MGIDSHLSTCVCTQSPKYLEMTQGHISLSLVFVTLLVAIKSKFAFTNNYDKELVNLINDVLLKNHKMPKDMYQSKNFLSGLVTH